MTARFLTTRRQVLKQLGVALGGLTIGAGAHGSVSLDDSVDRELAAAISRLIEHGESAAVIGEAWLSQSKTDHSPAALSAQIMDSLPNSGEGISERSLLEQIRSDFDQGDVVNLHGWLLSRTEARVCALFAAR